MGVGHPNSRGVREVTGAERGSSESMRSGGRAGQAESKKKEGGGVN